MVGVLLCCTIAFWLPSDFQQSHRAIALYMAVLQVGLGLVFILLALKVGKKLTPSPPPQNSRHTSRVPSGSASPKASGPAPLNVAPSPMPTQSVRPPEQVSVMPLSAATDVKAPPKKLWWQYRRNLYLGAVGLLVLIGFLGLYAHSRLSDRADPSLRPTGRGITVLKDKTSFESEKKYAVVVGIDKYPPQSGLRQLQFAVADAIAISDELRHHGYEVSLLTDAQALRNSVLQALDDMKGVAQSGQGTLIFYFAGHGGQTGGTQYLATYETAVETFSEASLSLEKVRATLASAPAPRRIMLIDACRNDPTLNPTRGRDEVERFSLLTRSTGVRILNSAAPGHTSFEDPDRKHGVFTFALIEGLKGEAAGADGLITFADLANYVWTRVPQLTFGRFPLQTPYEAGEFGGDFLIAKKRENPSAAASIPVAQAKPHAEARPESAPAPKCNKPSIAALPFVNSLNDPKWSQFDLGIADGFADAFARDGRFCVVERSQLDKALKELDLNQSQTVDPSTAQRIGLLIGARYLVVGSFQVFEGQMRVNARILRVETGAIVAAETVTGAAQNGLSLPDQAARKLVNGIKEE